MVALFPAIACPSWGKAMTAKQHASDVRTAVATDRGPEARTHAGAAWIGCSGDQGAQQ